MKPVDFAVTQAATFATKRDSFKLRGTISSAYLAALSRTTQNAAVDNLALVEVCVRRLEESH